MEYDAVLSYSKSKEMVNNVGFKGWLDYLRKMFPAHRLYAVSQDWYSNKKYVCKARGENGDIIIGWKE